MIKQTLMMKIFIYSSINLIQLYKKRKIFLLKSYKAKLRKLIKKIMKINKIKS